MRNTVAGERFLLLYLPWLFSLLVNYNPIVSYLSAWIGSFIILFLTIGGHIRPIPKDLDMSQQFMRPIFLTQIIFAGYMCLTSIFYFSSVLGYDNFEAPIKYSPDFVELELVAKCQRYYCLGHAAMATGILLLMHHPKKPKYHIKNENTPDFLFKFALFALPFSVFLNLIPGFFQFSNQFSNLSFIAGTLALAHSIPSKKIFNIIICTFLYISNLLSALLSGFKEPVIVSILILGIFLYPFYKRTVYIIFIPLLIILITVLPSYVTAFRQSISSGEVDVKEASNIAFENLNTQTETEKEETNWAFLTDRFSEIGMFTKYIRSTPENIDFYGFEIIKQSFFSIIPRVLWPTKPVTEEMVMERVYAADIVDRGSMVSAKPQVAADAYLSGGALGIFITFIIYGVATQYISLKAETLFGGYVLGSALMYSGLFQMFWRGLTFEFLFNSVFWSYFTMWIIFMVLKWNKILIKN